MSLWTGLYKGLLYTEPSPKPQGHFSSLRYILDTEKLIVVSQIPYLLDSMNACYETTHRFVLSNTKNENRSNLKGASLAVLVYLIITLQLHTVCVCVLCLLCVCYREN